MTSRTRDASARVPRKVFRTLKKGVTEDGGRRARAKTIERLVSHLGRPLHVDQDRRNAPPSIRDDWHRRDTSPPLDGLSGRQRETLARAWLRDGLAEHATVASHARFTLQLLSLGAPPQLVRASQRASLDVIRHAEDCFGLASAYAGRTLGPGVLDTTGALDGPIDLRQAVIVAIRGGCVCDTISAMSATVAAEQCTDAVIAKVLRRIAVDQTRHAGLAWRFVRWALNRPGGDLVTSAIEEAFEVALADHPPVEEKPAPAWMRERGRLSDEERACLAASTLREVIVPCAEAVLELTDDDDED